MFVDFNYNDYVRERDYQKSESDMRCPDVKKINRHEDEKNTVHTRDQDWQNPTE